MTAPTLPESGPAIPARLTLVQFAARYGLWHRTAAKWIDSGQAPAKRIPGTNRYVILEAWCDAFDRGEPGFWSEVPAQPEQPVTTSPFIRALPSKRKAG